MKRSEMIDEITCVLLAYGASYPQYPLSNLAKTAEEILNVLEDKGMLPPTSTCYIVDSPRGPKHSAVGHWWDNEDDTPKE